MIKKRRILSIFIIITSCWYHITETTPVEEELVRVKQSLTTLRSKLQTLTTKLDELKSSLTQEKAHDDKPVSFAHDENIMVITAQEPSSIFSWGTLNPWKTVKKTYRLYADRTLDQQLSEIENSYKQGNLRGILISGPTKSGKTTLANIIAIRLGKSLENLPIPAKGVYQRRSGPKNKILLIDNVDTFASKAEFGLRKESDTNKITWLKAFMDDWDAHKSLVIATSIKPYALIEDIIRSQFTKTIDLTLPTLKLRTKILIDLLKEKQIPIEESPLLDSEVLHHLMEFSYEDLKALVAEAAHLKKEDLLDKITTIRKSRQLPELKPPATTRLSDLIFSEDLKNVISSIQRQVEALKKAAKENKYTDKKGILLYGPPGSGKTELARAIANESGVSFLVLSLQTLADKYVGSGTAAIKHLYDEAETLKPCIVFIDEFESLGKREEIPPHESYKIDMINLLLQLLDGLLRKKGVLTIAATNYPLKIDDALHQRFTLSFQIPLPNLEIRKQLIQTQAFLSNLTENIEGSNLAATLISIIKSNIDTIASITRGCSTRQLMENIPARINAQTSNVDTITRDSVLKIFSDEVKKVLVNLKQEDMPKD